MTSDAAWATHTIGSPVKWATVDMTVLRDNTRALVQHANGAKVMAMIKANGYGHGALLVARAAIAGGASWLGVSSADEAFQLRAGGVTVPILVVGWTHSSVMTELITQNVDVTVASAESVRAVANAARQAGTRARIQVKVDTGMNRFGAMATSLPELETALRECASQLEITGIFTHFADADGDSTDDTYAQHAKFMQVLPQLRELAPDALVHCSNSAAILRFPEFHHALVRPGIALYGYPPPHCRGVVDISPALSVLACVMHVKTIEPGERVGYGLTWKAERRSRIATIAAGYADGISRHLSNTGSVLVAGKRCPIVGRVSMDQTCVDVTDADDVAVGDAVSFLGAGLNADDIAATLGTVSYEVICAVSARVPRVVINDI